MMDFEKVKDQIIKAYRGCDTAFSLEEVTDIFGFFYDEYFRVMGRSHPYMTIRTIQHIINELDHLTESEDDFAEGIDLTVDDYMEMIIAYFKTAFNNCNYSIAHFMSGKIRMLRYYESCY